MRIVGIPAVFRSQLQHFGPSEPAYPPERGEGRHVEVDGSSGLVRVPGIERRPDQRQDLGDGRGGPGLGIDRQKVQHPHFSVEACHLLCGEIQIMDAELARLAEDVVVHVGDVAHALRLVPEVTQTALQHVEIEVDGSVAEVGRVVRGDATGVHRHQGSRLERHDLFSGGVVQLHS